MPADRIPIARFSAITRISQKALRYYDRKGILVPAAKDPFTGYRYYTASQMELGVKIAALCSLGFSLEDLRAYLLAQASGDRETVERLKDRQLSSIRSELLRLQKIEALLQEQTAELIGMALTEPTVKDVPEQRVLSKKGKGILSRTIGKLIGELCSFVALPTSRRNQLKVTGPIMAIYNEDCTDGKEADLSDWSDKEVTIEVALPIAGKAEVEGSGIEVKSLPAARVLSLIHRGSYPTIHKSYRAAFEHMAAGGLEVAGPIRELYLNDPDQTAEEELMTEIQIPFRKEQG
ncbi:MAG TPA: GyrI-like domain-containing protein [Methanothrix sp.]|nr:GyrI-like domain-containing protein [Methanothrix sp.]